MQCWQSTLSFEIGHGGSDLQEPGLHPDEHALFRRLKKHLQTKPGLWDEVDLPCAFRARWTNELVQKVVSNFGSELHAFELGIST